MTGAVLVHRLRRSSLVYILVGALAPALICTFLAQIWYPQWWQLVGYFWYSVPANTFIYLPHEPAVIYAGSLYEPWMVAIVGGLATIVGATIDYTVMKKVFELPKIASVKQTAFYKTAVRYFYWQPWWTLVVFAFSILPDSPIRVLAPSSNYPRWKYISAIVTGRVPRYYLFALGGASVHFSLKYLLLLIPFILVMSLLSILWARWRSRSQSRLYPPIDRV